MRIIAHLEYYLFYFNIQRFFVDEGRTQLFPFLL